jgi:hypothetical protein
MGKKAINNITALMLSLCLATTCNANVINLAASVSDGKVNYVGMEKVLYGNKKSVFKSKWARYGLLVTVATIVGGVAVKSNSHRHHKHNRVENNSVKNEQFEEWYQMAKKSTKTLWPKTLTEADILAERRKEAEIEINKIFDKHLGKSETRMRFDFSLWENKQN